MQTHQPFENILGKGILSPEREARLRRHNVVFATLTTTSSGRPLLLAFKRPPDETAQTVFATRPRL